MNHIEMPSHIVSGSSILLLGEGNFSFARGLWCSGILSNNETQMFATAFESEDDVFSKYGNEARDNVLWLKCQKGVAVIFNVDATAIEICKSLRLKLFDSIMFNFPHPCTKTNKRKSKILLKGFFQSAATHALSDGGRILVTLAAGQSGLNAPSCSNNNIQQDFVLEDFKSGHNVDSWQVVYMAAYGGLVLDAVTDFSEIRPLMYKPTGYRSANKHFQTENAKVYSFVKANERANSATIETLALDTITVTFWRPYYVHDIAFWCETKTFSEDEFIVLTKKLSRNLVKSIKLLEAYSSLGRNDASCCYRFVWHSNCYSLCKEDARDLQLWLRERLEEYYSQRRIKFILR